MKRITLLDADSPILTPETIEVDDSMAPDFENAKFICTDYGALLGVYPFDEGED